MITGHFHTKKKRYCCYGEFFKKTKLKYKQYLWERKEYKRNHPKVTIDSSGVSSVDILDVLLSDKGRESLEMCAMFAREQRLRSAAIMSCIDTSETGLTHLTKEELYEKWSKVLTTPVSPQNTKAMLIESKESSVDTKDYKALYLDLIMQVARKYPGETRHETAKRYIENVEILTLVQARPKTKYIKASIL